MRKEIGFQSAAAHAVGSAARQHCTVLVQLLLQTLSHPTLLTLLGGHLCLPTLFSHTPARQDFVINTIDRPLHLQLSPSKNDPPVMRFCKTASHSDILIPIYHYHMKNFDGGILEEVPRINKTYPCEARELIEVGSSYIEKKGIHTRCSWQALPCR